MCTSVAAQKEALHWLSRAFWDVPDASMLAAFRREAFAFAGPDAEKGLDLIERASLSGEGALVDMRVDYSALFCGFDPNAPFPYESVYRGEKRLLMQPVRDEVLDLYREAEYEPEKGEGNEPEDHLSFELAALAFLLPEFEDDGSSNRKERLDDLRSRLLEEHLRVWVPEFCAEVSQGAQTDLYRGIAATLPRVLAAI